MTEAVRHTAGVVAFTERHPTSRIWALINQGLGALSRLCRTTNPEFQPIASTTITTDGLATAYALPVDFRSLLSVVYTDGDGRTTWLNPYEPHERASLTTESTESASLRATCYRLLGTNLELLPLPPADHTALIWYATTVTQLASGSATMETMERLDTYVIWWAARELSADNEAWERHDRLTAKLSELEADIRILARSLDLSHPARVVDLAYANLRTRRRR